MNDVQCFIDRQLGIYCRFNYDNILKRLVVSSEESYYGLQTAALPAAFDQDPPIFACRFSEAPGFEHILALANEDGRVAIQDTTTVRSASSLESFQCHNNAVFDLAWMPKNMNFVTVSGDHTASLWDIAEGSPKQVLVFTHHTRSVKTAVFRPNEPSVFATGARDGHILIWDIRVNNQPFVVMKPDNCLMNCHSSFTPKTPGSHGKRPRMDPHRAISITGLAFQDDATLLSCGECDGNIKVWDLRKSYSAHTREPLPKHSIPYCGGSTKNGYTNLIVDETRTRLYASCMDNVIYCFNIATYNALPQQRYVGHENGTFYIKTGLSGDGAYLVSGSSDKHAYVWSVRRAEPVVRLAGHWAEVTCAAWCPQGGGDLKLVTCSDDARHKIWRVGRELLEGEPQPLQLQGRAEPPPRAPRAAPPLWGRTPRSLKRSPLPATPATPTGKRARADRSARKTKRCLADLLNASRDGDAGEPKRFRPLPDVSPVPEEPRLLPAGVKRQRPPARTPERTPEKRFPGDPRLGDWSSVPRADASFASPTKNYERRSCKALSPRSPKPMSPSSVPARSPARASPTKARVITFATPTKDLPNFALHGEAPHHRLMSPARKKRDAPDWLTLMGRGRASAPAPAPSPAPAPASPKQSAPARRNSATDRTPKSNTKSRTLLKYFTVKTKEK